MYWNRLIFNIFYILYVKFKLLIQQDIELNSNQIPKVTIGIPVYNGEREIRRAIDSVLAQTFTNFECVISDNASTDQTELICKEYEKIDKRITYIRKKENLGPLLNFLFLLKRTNSDYFSWLSHDDYWEPSFLEKNVSILNSNKNIVGSIGLVKYVGQKEEHNKENLIFKIKNLVKRGSNKNFKKYIHVRPVSGIYEKKVSTYLRFNQASFVYGLFRTDKLQNRMVSVNQLGWDLLLILNILKEGDLNVIDEVLLHRFVSGVNSGTGYINFYKKKIIPIRELIFPGSTLFIWCLKNIGIKFILKNLDWFVLLVGYGWMTIIQEYKTKKYRN